MCLLLSLFTFRLSGQSAGVQPSLDYEVFKTRVQPVFLNKRPGNARCVSCHTSDGAAYLQPLPSGQRTWDGEFHGGGKHFTSRHNREWQVLGAWVRGEKQGAVQVPKRNITAKLQ